MFKNLGPFKYSYKSEMGNQTISIRYIIFVSRYFRHSPTKKMKKKNEARGFGLQYALKLGKKS